MAYIAFAVFERGDKTLFERIDALGVLYKYFAVLGKFEFFISAKKQLDVVFVFEMFYVLTYGRLRKIKRLRGFCYASLLINYEKRVESCLYHIITNKYY